MSNVTMSDELPGFDEPLALLRACHKNILAHCDRLEALVAHIDEQGIDDEARKAARDIVRYFQAVPGCTIVTRRKTCSRGSTGSRSGLQN